MDVVVEVGIIKWMYKNNKWDIFNYLGYWVECKFIVGIFCCDEVG